MIGGDDLKSQLVIAMKRSLIVCFNVQPNMFHMPGEGAAEVSCDHCGQALISMPGVGGDIPQGSDLVAGRIDMDPGDAEQCFSLKMAEILSGIYHPGIEPVLWITRLVKVEY